jgi:hypothetical protein
MVSILICVAIDLWALPTHFSTVETIIQFLRSREENATSLAVNTRISSRPTWRFALSASCAFSDGNSCTVCHVFWAPRREQSLWRLKEWQSHQWVLHGIDPVGSQNNVCSCISRTLTRRLSPVKPDAHPLLRRRIFAGPVGGRCGYFGKFFPTKIYLKNNFADASWWPEEIDRSSVGRSAMIITMVSRGAKTKKLSNLDNPAR